MAKGNSAPGSRKHSSRLLPCHFHWGSWGCCFCSLLGTHSQPTRGGASNCKIHLTSASCGSNSSSSPCQLPYAHCSHVFFTQTPTKVLAVIVFALFSNPGEVEHVLKPKGLGGGGGIHWFHWDLLQFAKRRNCFPSVALIKSVKVSLTITFFSAIPD